MFFMQKVLHSDSHIVILYKDALKISFHLINMRQFIISTDTVISTDISQGVKKYIAMTPILVY